ncbi:hypothetical protein TSUD_142800, partial [Trifolium subterraneum]
MEFLVVLVIVLLGSSIKAYGAINQLSWREISNINNQGPYFGIVVPNAFELNPLLQSSSFVPHNKFPYFDFAGRHFRIGKLEKKKVIVVMTGESMLNAGLATQLLLTLFNVKGVLHYGIAGNANSKFQIGDVTIPKYWAHTGQWHWQRFGDKDEDNGDFNREFGYLKFSNYNNYTKHSKPVENLLNKPIVVRVKKGVSANVFVDNRAYRDHLKSKFDVTPTDMESAAVALVCFQQKIPFIAIRALSDLAGGGSALTNE